MAFDGLTWTVLDELIEEGLAPNFGRLKENGTFATLNTLPIGSSPEIWTTIATGRAPRVHGVNGHVSFRLPLMERRFFVPHYLGFNYFVSPLLASTGMPSSGNVLREGGHRWSAVISGGFDRSANAGLLEHRESGGNSNGSHQLALHVAGREDRWNQRSPWTVL